MKDEKAKRVGQDMKAHILVGKKGLDENMQAEIARRLEDEKLLKIKILRNAPVRDMDVLAGSLVEHVGGRVVEIRGNTILLAEK